MECEPKVAADIKAGLRLADRYRLEHALRRDVGGAMWLALDEKLNRQVWVDLLAVDDPRADAVLRAARASSIVTDPRFVQVLDAVVEDGLAYVVREWPGDTVSLAELLADGPMPIDEAVRLAADVADAMAGAHEMGMPHQLLDPRHVLCTPTGQVKIVGLRLDMALTSDDPDGGADDLLSGFAAGRAADDTLTGARGDTEALLAADAHAVGGLLYAMLTGKWPFGAGHGLPAAPTDGGRPCTPAQVRAGVPHAVDELTTRILLDPPPRGRPLRTAREISTALSALPRQRPEPEPMPGPRAAQTGGLAGLGFGTGRPGGEPPAPLSSKPARFAKAAVAGVLLVAVGLLAWQLKGGGGGSSPKSSTPPSGQSGSGSPSASSAAPQPITAAAAQVWDSKDDSEDPADAAGTINGTGSGWRTYTYLDGPQMKIKPGTGIIYDLGSVRSITSAQVQIMFPGATVQMLAADSGMTALPGVQKSAPPGFTTIATQNATSTTVTLTAAKPVNTRYVLIWFTALPHESASQYGGAGYSDGIQRVRFFG
jgi:hypothetical protein